MSGPRIALVQRRNGEDRAANLAAGLADLDRAAATGAHLVAFPELAFEPFFPRHPRAEGAPLPPAETIPGPTTDALCERARRHGVAVVTNLYEQDGHRRFDSSPVIDADGTLLGVQRMLHITEYEGFHEQQYYDPGDGGAPVFDTAAGRLGVAICYDRHYPDVMRRLADGGADLVVVPQAGAVGEWPEGLYEAELRVAAFQNGIFTALCNRVGPEPPLDFAGESFVCDPDGVVVARAPAGEEHILVADLELDRLEGCAARRLFRRHRRDDW
jgi:N-carbamoylputrescine amidase